MAVIGTFGSFTAARLGIYASQASLQVTGNNIANINTTGYTRQRADLFSLNATGLAKYASGYGVDIGYGVLVNQVNQLRDPYLDIRFRNQNTKLGEIDATLSGLQRIAQTLDEVNKGGTSQNGVIENALQEFESMLQELKVNVGSEEYDSLVREAAKSLTSFFNTAADKLQEDWNLQVEELQSTVEAVNKCLTNIRDLNEQIRKQGIYGDNALELRDNRNLYIDELSSYLGINVEYSMEKIDQFTEVEKLTITLKDTKDPKTGQPIKLVDGLYATQLTFSEKEVNPFYTPKGQETHSEIFALEKDGKYWNGTAWTANIRDAEVYRQNPKYDKDATPPMAEYLDKNGNSVTQAQLDARVAQVGATKAALVSDKKYLTANGEPTDVEDDAGVVDSKKFLLQLERLEDKFGRVLDRNRSTESVAVPLNDTELQGSIQAMRELLTEEGEFASKKDIGASDDMSYSDWRAADDRANIKKGIPYYQRRLDLLAQKIAEIFNEANQLPASEVYQTNYAGDMAKDMNSNDEPEKSAVGASIFKDIDANDITYLDVDGNPPKPVTVDTVTIVVPAVDADGKQKYDKDGVTPLYERVALTDCARVREALRKENNPDTGAPYTEEEIDKKLQNAAKALEALRENGVVNEGYEYYDGGVLFSSSGNNNDPTGITAANISISNAWSERIVRVLNTTKPSEIFSDGSRIDHSSDNDNILHMISLFEKQLYYRASELRGFEDASGGNLTFFHGSFQEMYTDLGATLGMEQSITSGIEMNYELMTLDLDNDRISVYGVDLNDEATSMMQFQKSYQAACRLLTTIDAMLDTLINRTI